MPGMGIPGVSKFLSESRWSVNWNSPAGTILQFAIPPLLSTLRTLFAGDMLNVRRPRLR